MPIQINTGTSTTGVANVGTANNTGAYSLQVNMPTTAANAGFVALACQADAGTVTGTPVTRELDVTDDYRLRVGTDTMMFQDVFAGAAINSALWTSPVTTMAVAVAGGFLSLNSASSTANAGVARVSSYRSFPVYGSFSTYCEIWAQFPFVPVTSNVTEWGVGIATGTAAPTDGAFFRLDATGAFKAVVNNNGTEILSSALNFATLVGANTTRHFLISLGESNVTFWIDNVLVATVARATAGGVTVASMALPILLRTYNTALTASGQQVKVAQATVTVGDMNGSKPWADILSGTGQMAYQGQTGGTMGTTANYANSANPTAAAINNTTPNVTGLGGQVRITAAAAAVTDGIITSFQVPVGTAALPGKTLYITGVKISAVNNVAAVATTASTIAWSLAFGHTAAPLNTAESSGAGTKAARRIAMGFHNWAIAAPIGALGGPDLAMNFRSPIVVQPGEFFQTVAKFLNGTATATQVIDAHITVDAYYE